ncbi:uncharacterized protein Dana_GF22025 [Drosophila ananassae]|uniref:Uncharacterized protein n=1 Tax=Drosophila ananassae TaxID=7217 RepID=B3MYI2_DROAN|nr:uncharacterized protein LOC6504694 [Drosophila ananassae]EDV32676.1 uncharacterized protein Dana_GF22025 [Drosophila ananassae]
MSSSAANRGLIVEGIPLGMGRQFTPRLTMKRVYNTKCFRPERYRHEVANHYRDYKLQQHLYQQHHVGPNRRRRRRRPYGSESTRVSGTSLASAYVQFRDVWPTHVHNFPRFDDTFTSRGRRTVCTTGLPTDEPYNDAVRRIRSSQSCSQLRQLVQRAQLSSRIRLTNSDCETGRSSCSSHGKTSNRWRSQSSSHAINYQLNINIAAATTETQQSPETATETEKETKNHQQPVDFYGYLQLASGYYERGVQANIAYLESIGRKKQHKQQQQQQHQQQQRNAIKAPLSGLFLDSPTNQALAIPGQKLTGRLLTLLKSLKSKVIKRRGQSPEPGIRVDIRSLINQEEDQEDQEEDQAEEEEEDDQEAKEESPPLSRGNSMCDYYAEESKQSSSTRYPSCQTLGATSATLGATVEATAVTLEAIATRVPALGVAGPDHRCVYEIIDNLSHLSIGESGCRPQQQHQEHQQYQTLPQITLTDCTAQQVALYSASFDIIQLQIPNEARPPTRD